MSPALVSIGVPVYNGAPEIGGAIASLLRQTHGELEILVSDNGSTDETWQICLAAAASDPRVTVIRHPHNRGALANFEYVVDRACGAFFMWAAADDRWDARFIAANLAALDDPQCVGSISRVRMTMPRGKSGEFTGTFPLRGRFSKKVAEYLRCPGQNSRFYGVYRRGAIQRSLVREPFIGADWATMINVLRHGDLHEVDETLMERGSRGESSRLHSDGGSRPLATRIRTSLVLAPFTRWLARNLPRSVFLACLPRIVELNARYAAAAVRGR